MREDGAHLVVGADGAIGRSLADHLAGMGRQVFETTRRPDTLSARRSLLDLAGDISSWQPPARVAAVFLCGAVCSLEECRKNPAQSALVNVEGTVELARRLTAQGAFVVFLSSNLVFDGSVPHRKAREPVCPSTVYGRQKARAERALLALGEAVSVVRFTKVIGPDTPLLKGWVEALRRGEVIHPFSDMVMAPVARSFAIEVLSMVAERGIPGILQVSGEKDITYQQVAEYMVDRLGGAAELVRPLTAGEKGIPPEAIPLHTTLDTTRLRVEWGRECPGVWQAVDLALGIS